MGNINFRLDPWHAAASRQSTVFEALEESRRMVRGRVAGYSINAGRCCDRLSAGLCITNLTRGLGSSLDSATQRPTSFGFERGRSRGPHYEKGITSGSLA